MLSSGSGPAGGAMEGAAEGLLAARRAAASSSSLCSSAADGRVRGGHCVPQEGGQRGSRLKPFNRTRTLSCCAPTMRPLCAPTMCPLAVHPPRAHLMCTHYIPTSAVHPLHAHLCRAPTMCPLTVHALCACLCCVPTMYPPTARPFAVHPLCVHLLWPHCVPTSAVLSTQHHGESDPGRWRPPLALAAALTEAQRRERPWGHTGSWQQGVALSLISQL